MVRTTTRLTKVMALVFKRDLHGNSPSPKPKTILKHVNLTLNKDIASLEEHE
jgi:hypothetical protein